MNGETLIRLTTTPAPRAGQPRRGPRTSLRGGVALMLFWTVLAGAFLWDVSRTPPGPGAWEPAGATRPAVLARAQPLPARPSP